jgi:DNA polymerase-3 subunit delta'
LITENEEDLIQTIRSRCQIYNGLSEPIIAEALGSKENKPKTGGKNCTSGTGITTFYTYPC